MKPRIAFAVWLGICCLGLGVPALLDHLIAITPNTMLARADAGRFQASATSAGGFFTPGITTIQTTQGSFLIHRPLSLQRGQSLAITRTLKHGVRLCVAGTPPVCSKLAGHFAGRLPPVSHVLPRFASLVTHVGTKGVDNWFGLGSLGAFLSGLLLAAVSAHSDNVAEDEPE